MLNKPEFKSIKKEMDNKEKQREFTIQLSREIIHLSKQVIYSLHRNNLKYAILKAEEMSKKVKNLHKDSDLSISNTAIQEYVEAIAFLGYVKNKRIPTKKSMNVDAESYLCGLSDLTGELVRKAINLAINKEYNEAIKIKILVEDIYEQLLMFDLRNSELRKKFDSIKYNLKKLDDLVYEIKMKHR